MSSGVPAPAQSDASFTRALPWAFIAAVWLAWSVDVALAFLHEDCVGCLQLRIVLVLFVLPVMGLTVAVLRGWFAGHVPPTVYAVGGAIFALLLVALLALL